MNEQTGWLPEAGPEGDPRPIETGGAVVVIRLTPDEVARLSPGGESLVDALHTLIEHDGGSDR